MSVNYCPYCKHRLDEAKIINYKFSQKRHCSICGKTFRIKEIEE